MFISSQPSLETPAYPLPSLRPLRIIINMSMLFSFLCYCAITCTFPKHFLSSNTKNSDVAKLQMCIGCTCLVHRCLLVIALLVKYIERQPTFLEENSWCAVSFGISLLSFWPWRIHITVGLVLHLVKIGQVKLGVVLWIQALECQNRRKRWTPDSFCENRAEKTEESGRNFENSAALLIGNLIASIHPYQTTTEHAAFWTAGVFSEPGCYVIDTLDSFFLHLFFSI